MAKKQKVYIVVSIAYDYNDEFYSSHEDNPGSTVKAYRDKKKAEDECARLNKAHLQSIEAGGLYKWAYDSLETVLTWWIGSKDVDKRPELKQLFWDMGCRPEHDAEQWKGPEDISDDYITETMDFKELDGTDEQWAELVKLLSFCEGYKVEEVEMEDG